MVPGSVAVYVPLYLAAPIHALHLQRGLSALLFVAGTAIYLWCLWDFAAFGRGTPAPLDAPRRLVVRGLYRTSRNPMYVGVLTILAGWLVLAPSVHLAIYVAGVGLVFHLVVVLYEEPRLRRQFGGEYRAYQERVGRWL